jgi:hypothetical protein
MLYIYIVIVNRRPLDTLFIVFYFVTFFICMPKDGLSTSRNM